MLLHTRICNFILFFKTVWFSVRHRRVYFQGQPQILYCYEVLAIPQHFLGYHWMILNQNYTVCIMFVSKSSSLRCLDLIVIWDTADVVRSLINRNNYYLWVFFFPVISYIKKAKKKNISRKQIIWWWTMIQVILETCCEGLYVNSFSTFSHSAKHRAGSTSPEVGYSGRAEQHSRWGPCPIGDLNTSGCSGCTGLKRWPVFHSQEFRTLQPFAVRQWLDLWAGAEPREMHRVTPPWLKVTSKPTSEPLTHHTEPARR